MPVLKRPLIATAVAAGVAAISIGAAFAQFGTAVAATTCVPLTNIEIILDDSGSMDVTDSGKLRVAGTKLLLSKSINSQKTFGAVQFGSDASTVFAPAVAGPNLAGMEGALDAQINADDGTTNYNAAFDKARTDNPNANARIFLTDGSHNEGDYLEGHRGGPRTDVIGFGSSTFGEDGQRLARIASETGGTYYPQTDSSNLQAVMNQIDAVYNCLAAPKSFTDLFVTLNQTKTHAIKVTRRTRSIDTVLSWAGPENAFDVVSARIVRKGRTVALSRKRKHRKPVKLRITRSTGATYVSLKISRVRRGRLKLKVRANRLLLPTTLTTQITPSRRR
jgi:hypothetical protein